MVKQEVKKATLNTAMCMEKEPTAQHIDDTENKENQPPASTTAAEAEPKTPQAKPKYIPMHLRVIQGLV